MSNYTQSTNFATKDSLPSGDPLKIVKGTEINTEFNNISVAIATKADTTSPTFTGTPLAPTASAGTNNTQLATTAYADAAIVAERTATTTLTNKSLTSPTLTGTPVAPTAAVNTNTTQVATTAYVVAQIADDAPTKTGTGASGSWAIDITGNAATANSATSATTATALSTASGSAPSYSARAWVNFNGVPASGTYGRTGTLVTIAMTSHGMTTGQNANLTFSAGTGGTATSGSYSVTVIDANNFTITDSASGTITGSPSVTRNIFIRASGNVSSITDNGTGDYTVNFTTAMADANYAVTRDATNSARTEGWSVGLVSQTTSATRLIVRPPGFGAADMAEVSVVIHC